MKRFDYAAAALALVLLSTAAAAPALASDFYTPSPVPSARDNAKTTATTKTGKGTTNPTRDFILNKKIVKTTKPTGNSTTPATKVPGAL